MNKYNITINKAIYEIDSIESIYNVCLKLGINIPSIYLNDDICFVEVNGELVDSTKAMIEEGMIIETYSELVNNFILDKISKLHSKLDNSCTNCPVIECPLKKYFIQFNLELNKSNSFKECMYYSNGIKNNVLAEKECHTLLKNILGDKNLHKVAIIDKNMEPKKALILNKGFNEVITSDYFKKFKIVEESALILKEIAKGLEKREFKKPCVVLEDYKDISLVPYNIRKNIIRVGTIEDIAKRILDLVLDTNEIKYFFITDDDFDNINDTKITLEYISNLEDVESSENKILEKELRLDHKEVNYNSFVSYLNDLFGFKQTIKNDIYNSSTEYIYKIHNKTIKLVNYLNTNLEDADIVLVLKEDNKNITSSVLYDVDVNYIYKNYIKEPGNL